MPIFLGLVGDQSKGEQAKTALRASITCVVVLGAFAVAGSLIFSFFGITIPAFKIAGGILLFGVGLEMMRARRSETRSTSEEQVEAEGKEDVGLIPLGLPLLSGPGAIATVMVLVGKAKSFDQRVALYVAILVVTFLTFLILRSAGFFARVLGRTGINVIGRVMGLILSAVAIQFVLDGIQGAFPTVGGGAS